MSLSFGQADSLVIFTTNRLVGKVFPLFLPKVSTTNDFLGSLERKNDYRHD